MSWQAIFFNLFLRLFFKKWFIRFAAETSTEKLIASVIKTRKILKKYVKQLSWQAKVEEIIIANNLRAKWVSSKSADTHHKTILYFHGGGYLFGSAESYAEFAFRLSVATNAKVLLIDYRLLPEYPLNCVLEDAVNAYKYLIDIGMDTDNIIFAGDSAGGGLALSTVAKLKDEHQALPKAVICLSPWTDLLLTSNSLINNQKSDACMVMPKKLLLFDGVDLASPYVSPLYADLKGFPAIYIQVSSTEILLDDSRRLAEKAKKSNVTVKLEIWEGMPHCWQLFSQYLPEGKKAISNIAQFIASS